METRERPAGMRAEANEIVMVSSCFDGRVKTQVPNQDSSAGNVAGPAGADGADGAAGVFCCGLRVISVDGPVTDLPDTPGNAAFFGRPSNATRDGAFPQVRWGANRYACNTTALTMLIRTDICLRLMTPRRAVANPY
jgi:hypothetical protein